MAARSSWKGYLRLSLLSIPVKAYTAANGGGEDLHLHQLHRDCHHRVRYQKVCPVHGEIQHQDIVSGYESAPGQFVVIDPHELDGLRTESDKSIRVETFIRSEGLDAAYHSGKTYYLVPDGPIGQRAYALLRSCLSNRRMHGVAQIVLSGREQLVLLRPVGRLLAMTVLNYDAHVKPCASFEDEVQELELSPQEHELGETLVSALAREDFEFSAYDDLYRERLTRLIEAKLNGQPLVAAAMANEPDGTDGNLLEALQASLKSVQSDGAVSDGKPPAKMAPSVHERTPEPQWRMQSG